MQQNFTWQAEPGWHCGWDTALRLILISFLRSMKSMNAQGRKSSGFLARSMQGYRKCGWQPAYACAGVAYRLFSYGYPLLEPVQTIENIRIASLLDIGLMKLDAVIERGSRKDFYDLYVISRQIPLPKLLSAGERKYPQVRDFPLMALEGLLQFDNADRDLQPEGVE